MMFKHLEYMPNKKAIYIIVADWDNICLDIQQLFEELRVLSIFEYRLY